MVNVSHTSLKLSSGKIKPRHLPGRAGSEQTIKPRTLGAFQKQVDASRLCDYQRGMVRLRSRTNCPVGGFQFVDAAISHDVMQDWSFQSLVAQIITRRQQNPRFNLNTDVVAVSNEVDQQNAMRMQHMKGAESYIMEDGAGVPPPLNFPMARHARPSVAARLRATTAGAAALVGLLGPKGEPVARSEAERRAALCWDCPQNKKGGLLDFFTESAASVIRGQMALRSEMELSTSKDESLGVCKACQCPTKLKVWVDLDYIRENTTADQINAMDSRCWIPLK